MLVIRINPTGISLLHIIVAGRVQSSWDSGGFWLLRKSRLEHLPQAVAEEGWQFPISSG